LRPSAECTVLDWTGTEQRVGGCASFYETSTVRTISRRHRTGEPSWPSLRKRHAQKLRVSTAAARGRAPSALMYQNCPFVSVTFSAPSQNASF
jgi:hypothetical protein